MKTGGEVFSYNQNQRGDILSISDKNGKTVAKYTYDNWGNPLTKSVSVDSLKDQPLRYASYYYDEETSLYYLMARFYHPEQGVFLSLDSETDSDETIEMSNGYSYVGNNPIIKTDPSGKTPMNKVMYALKCGVCNVLKDYRLIADNIGNIAGKIVAHLELSRQMYRHLKDKNKSILSRPDTLYRAETRKLIKQVSRQIAWQAAKRSFFIVFGIVESYNFIRGAYLGWKRYRTGYSMYSRCPKF